MLYFLSVAFNLDCALWRLGTDDILPILLQTWMYIAVPLLLYAGERTLRSVRAVGSNVDVLKVK